jgi:DNA-binding response OmpR family regulator
MRILVVEDYAPVRSAVCQGLAEAGFAVDMAVDGEEGLWYAHSFEYDVVVLDLMLPKVNGLSILTELHKADNKAHVLILTAKDAVADKITGLNLGADDYLIKPFDFGELLARVRALVRRRYQLKNPLLSFQNLEIDTSAKRVRRGGREIDLTAREYALLEYLALRAGEIVSRTEIWEHVYDFHSSATSNVVDVYIGYLRRKLGLGGVDPLIRTYRGQGYAIEGPVT